MNPVTELRSTCLEIVSPEQTKLPEKISDLRGNYEETSVMIEELSALRHVKRNLSGNETLVWKVQENLDKIAIRLGKCPNCKPRNLIARKSVKTREI